MKSAELLLLAWDYKNSDIAFRDVLALSSSSIREFIHDAIDNGIAEEVAVLSTCNRTEFYFYHYREEIYEYLISWYKKQTDLEEYKKKKTIPEADILKNEDAVKHLMRVSAGLESMVLGENQILSQIKQAHNILLSLEIKIPLLSRLFQEAIRAGKAVRSRTALCEGLVSIGLVAVELAGKIYKDFSSHSILILGAGETARLTARHFKKLGANDIVIVNRGKKRREQLAKELEARHTDLESLEWVLPESDIVVAATSSKEYLIDWKMFEKVMKKREGLNMLLIDISSPRNIDPLISRSENVFLYDIDDLKEISKRALDKRQGEIPSALKIIENIANNFSEWRRSLEVVPIIKSLSAYFSKIQIQELEKVKNKVDEDEYQRMEDLSKSIIRKLLHYPIMHLRTMAEENHLIIEDLESIKRIFRLEDK